jgi:hypothetical protein
MSPATNNTSIANSLGGISTAQGVSALAPDSRAAEIMGNNTARTGMSQATSRARGAQQQGGRYGNSEFGVGVTTDGTPVSELSNPDQLSFTDATGAATDGLTRNTGTHGTSAFRGMGIAVVLSPFTRESALRHPVTISQASAASNTAYGAPIFVSAGRGSAVLVVERGRSPVIFERGFRQ